jgi:hypothetical protein
MKNVEITLGNAYYNQGFFNIPIQFTDAFPKKNEQIDVYLDDIKIIAKVNRTANMNSTPRIMCGVEYKDWVQKNFKKGDIMQVCIYNEKEIKIFSNK